MCWYGYVQWACGCAPDHQIRLPTALSCVDNGPSCPRASNTGNLNGTVGPDGKLRLNYLCQNCQYNIQNPEYNPPAASHRTDTIRPRPSNNQGHEPRGLTRQASDQQTRQPSTRHSNSNSGLHPPSRQPSIRHSNNTAGLRTSYPQTRAVRDSNDGSAHDFRTAPRRPTTQQPRTSRSGNVNSDYIPREASRRIATPPSRTPSSRSTRPPTSYREPTRLSPSHREGYRSLRDEQEREFHRRDRGNRAEIAALLRRRRGDLVQEL